MNRHLCKVAEPSFVTALYLLVEVAAGKVCMARAGHPPPMVFRRATGIAEEITAPGVMMMGFDDYDVVPVTETPLEPGDFILAYTDGLTERFDPGDQLYGEERLLKVIEAHGFESAEELCRGVVADLQRFAQGRPADDDQAFIAVRRE
jgi:sigma-B regulation protein RsbU (phosphoserine phosphatase)